MVFGYSTNAFVKFSLTESIARIARLGFSGVEIMGDRPHLYPPDYRSERLERLKGRLDELGLKVTNLNSFTLFAVGDTYLPSWIEPEKTRRDLRIRHTLDCLETAAFLGSPNISVPPGGPLEGMSRSEAMALFLHGIEQVAPTAEALGVRLLIEPEPNLLIENTREFKAFMADVRSPAVGINFDIGHFFCAGENPRVSLEALFGWVGHVHLEDIAETRVHRHLIPGHGAIDLPDVLRGFKTLGYDGDISLELYPYVDTPEAAGEESLAYLRPMFDAAELDIA
jgi:sugar phosphate isomerase/epimerase